MKRLPGLEDRGFNNAKSPSGTDDMEVFSTMANMLQSLAESTTKMPVKTNYLLKVALTLYLLIGLFMANATAGVPQQVATAYQLIDGAVARQDLAETYAFDAANYICVYERRHLNLKQRYSETANFYEIVHNVKQNTVVRQFKIEKSHVVVIVKTNQEYTANGDTTVNLVGTVVRETWKKIGVRWLRVSSLPLSYIAYRCGRYQYSKDFGADCSSSSGQSMTTCRDIISTTFISATSALLFSLRLNHTLGCTHAGQLVE